MARRLNGAASRSTGQTKAGEQRREPGIRTQGIENCVPLQHRQLPGARLECLLEPFECAVVSSRPT